MATREELELVLKARNEASAAFAALDKQLQQFSRSAKDTSEQAKKLSVSSAQVADSIGRVATKIASSASAFGLPAEAFRAIDDAADVAELGLKGVEGGLRSAVTASTAFSAATLGAVGAAAALGASLGTLLLKIPAVQKAADSAAASLYKMVTGMDAAALAKGPAGFDQSKIAASNAAAQKKQLEALKAAGLSGKEIAKIFGGVIPKALEGSVKAWDAATQAAEQHRLEIEALAASLSGADLEKQLADMAEALANGIKLTESGKQQIAETVGKGIADGVAIPASLIPIQQEVVARQIQEIIDGAIAKTTKKGTTTSLWDSVLGGGKEGVAGSKGVTDMLDRAAAGDKAIEDAARSAAAAQQALGARFIQAGQELQAFGSQIGGVFGALVSGIGMATAAWGDYQASAKGAADKTQLAVAALGAVAHAAGASMDSASGGKRALAGAASGAKLGMMVGSVIPGVGTVIGAAAGAVIGGIAGALKKPSWVKVGQEAGKILGTEVSKELAKQIEATAKELDVSIATASLLNLGDAMSQSGESAVSFGSEMSTLLKGIADGSVPATEGIAEMGEAFNQLAEEASAGSVAAMASMGALAQQARALGQEIPEITAAVEAAVSESAGALGALGGIKIVDADDARAQAAIFLNIFNGVLATEGIVAAAQALQPAIKTFQEQLASAGISKDVASTILGPINSAMSLMKNELTRGGAEGAQALKTILEGQLKSGFLDTGTFGAIQQQAKTAFDQMVKGGADSKAAFMAIAPLLAQIQQTAAATGTAVDSQTQALIDSAKAAGVAFPISPMERMVELMEVMVQGMGFEVPSAIQATASSISNTLPAATASAAAAASASLVTITGAAQETSTSFVAAFQGVGDQITSAITPGAVAIESQISQAFAAAGQDAQAFLSQLRLIGGTRLDIPIGFGGLGGLGGDFGIPSFAGGSGGIRDFGAGEAAILHGKEGVFTDRQLREMLREAVVAGARSGNAGGGVVHAVLELDGRTIARTQASNVRRNRGSTLTQNRKGHL